MLNSSLTDLLRLFNKEEWKRFSEYVNSPYFNKKSSVTKLLKAISKYFPDFDRTDLTRESLWNKIYPSKPYNYGVMKNLLHDLTKLAEDFAAQSMIDNSRTLLRSELLKYVHSKNNSKLVNRYSDRFEKNTSVYSGFDLYAQFEIEKIRSQVFYSQLSETLKQLPGEEFSKAADLLICSFLSELFEHGAMINELNKIHKAGIETPLLEEALGYVSSSPSLLKNKKIAAYYYLLMSEKKRGSGYFEMAREILEQADSEDDPRFLYYLWVNLANNLAFRFHDGDSSAQRELFELNKITIEKGILNPEGSRKIFVTNFNTLFNIATSENETEWAKNFVNEHYKLLEEEAREDIRHRCLADLSFRMRDYDSALMHLSKIEKMHEPHMKIYVRLLTTMSYYELGYFENCISSLDAFRHLLKNEKRLQEVIRIKYEKFIRALKHLLDARSGDENALIRFKIYIDSTDGITSINWLRRKAGEIEFQ